MNNLRDVIDSINVNAANPVTIVAEKHPNAVISYRGMELRIQNPQVQTTGKERYHATIIHTGRIVRGIFSNSATQRLCRAILYNTNVGQIRTFPEMPAAKIRSIINSGNWKFLTYWDMYKATLQKSLNMMDEGSEIPNDKIFQSILSSQFNAFIGRLEVIKNHAHLNLHSRTIELGYPSRGHSQFILYPHLAQREEEYIIREVFYEKAVELGADIVLTGKGHPGRRVYYNPEAKHSPTVRKLTVWENFGCDRRVKREIMSAVVNCQQFVFNNYSIPRVTSSDGVPDTLMKDNRIKFINCAVASMNDLHDLYNGAPTSADQIFTSGFTQASGLFDTLFEDVLTIDYTVGDTVESITEKYGKEHIVAVTKIERQEGPYKTISWRIARGIHKSSNMSFKMVETSGAVKGMTIPSNTLIVEKRDNEDFYRPVHAVISKQTITSKEAARTVLRMLASRLPEPTSFDSTTPREMFQEVMGDIRDQLNQVGDTGVSKLYQLKRSEKGSVKVLGFETKYNELKEVDYVGEVSGYLVPIKDDNNQHTTAVTGECAVMRMVHDQDFGKRNRSRENGNGVSLDLFMCEVETQPCPKTQKLLSQVNALYHNM